MPESDTSLKLADAMILALGKEGAQLIELESRERHDLTMREIPDVERLIMGQAPRASTGRLDELLKEGILERGTPGPDPFIAGRLRALDQLFSHEYFDTLSATAQRAYELTVQAHARRKRFHAGFGQCPTLPETSLRRALLVGEASNTGPLDILCIGDDDLISVPLAALGHRVTVFDIDSYLLSLLDLIRREENLDITPKEHDLRDPIRDEEKEKFDVFLTDPMSNGECFRLFISRAIPLLRQGGRGFVAVHPPAQEDFESVAREMKVRIEAWNRRHNRYYSHFMKLHQYESDWVELKKMPETTPSYAADAPVNPMNLYQEDYYQRRTVLLTLLDGLDEVRFAKPMFLDLIMDQLIGGAELEEKERTHSYQRAWSTITSITSDGHVCLHADRERHQIYLSAQPASGELIEALRYYLVAAFKTEAVELRTIKQRNFWDLRVI